VGYRDPARLSCRPESWASLRFVQSPTRCLSRYSQQHALIPLLRWSRPPALPGISPPACLWPAALPIERNVRVGGDCICRDGELLRKLWKIPFHRFTFLQPTRGGRDEIIFHDFTICDCLENLC